MKKKNVGWVSMFFFFKQKTAYEILTCDWSSDVCSSDLFIGHKTVIILPIYVFTIIT